MKFVFYGLMIPLAFVLGKVLYDPLFGGGGEVDVVASETVVEIKVKSPMGTITETVDLEDVDPKDYPDKITLSESAILTDKNGLSPLKLDPGSPVKPLLLDEMMLEITSPLATHLTGKVSVLDTNFADEVARKRMDRRMAMMEIEKGNPNPPATPATPVAPKPTKQEVAVVEEPSSKAGMTTPEPAPEAETEATPEPEAPTTLTAEQVVAAMKASLEGGKVKELDASKVTNWEAVEDESFDGEDFQVGIATYKEMTILGEKTLQAKALFSEGKLDKWIHAKTGMEIR